MIETGIQTEIMRAAGWKDDQIASLTLLKERVDNGKVDELTMDHKRLSFQKYRAERGAFANDGFLPKQGVIFESTPRLSLVTPPKI